MGKQTGIQIDPATGDLRIDPVRDGSGLIVRGLAVGEVTAQNQAVILRAAKGEFKEYPLFGAGVEELLGDHGTEGWEREIALQLEADGMTVREVEIDTVNENLSIDAYYNS